MAQEAARRVRFKNIATQFVVEDVIATAEYYRDVFGFQILGYFADPPVYAMVARDGVEMHFGKADARPADASSIQFRRVGFDAYIWVDDINALFDDLTASGADIVEGPVKRVYESTEVVVKDCNGFVLVFGD
ncbi:MAG: VOC family protein [Chloracidobacterium sp.]|nr:VOC family protein [Chloracidobacterium sp.]